MTDEQIDLAASSETANPKSEVKLVQFRKDLTHVLMHQTGEGEKAAGPLIVLGTYELQFKERAPLSALAELINGGLEGMRNYVLLSLENEDSRTDFASIQNLIDIDGLGEIINALGEGYSSFPEKS